ncbi:MAG TPA: lamin tail domain-containing protein, partial [Promineifilum sp.]
MMSLSRHASRITLLVLASMAFLLVQGAGTASADAPADLFISEYIEGSSLNKAIEIYNGTGAPVDLAAGGYKLDIYFNAAVTAGTTVNLTGSIADGDVYVVADDGANAAILAQTDQTSTASFFNGDDAVVLSKGATVLDVIGYIGPPDIGTEWGTGDTSTADNTIRRKSTVCAGDTNSADAFDPSLEWDGFLNDNTDGLGSHTANCVTAGPPVINEFVANHTGTDTTEYIEVFGAANTDLSALTLLHIEGDFSGTATGLIDRVYTVGTTDANGFWTTGFLADNLENGTMSLLLVEGFTGAIGN